jgi:hypothetical protein
MNMHDDEFKPSSIVFLVMSKETADKILVLGHLPLSHPEEAAVG